MARLIFHPKARKDFDEAVRYYRKISQQLSREFVFDFQSARRRVEKDPDSFSLYAGNYHYVQLSQFPYVLIYEWRKRRLLLVAVKHTGRSEDFWQDR